MAIKLSVGQSRKVSHNYNSKGFSLHIEAELPANAIDDPEQIAHSANDLFRLVEDLLAEQVREAGAHESGGRTEHHTRLPASDRGLSRQQGIPRQGDGYPRRSASNRSGNGANGKRRPATQAQAKAIMNMARRLDLNPDGLAEELFGVGGINELSVGDASQLIDHLKQQFEAAR